jgi:glycosyltransferase involved in cell wall biosynthesis
MVSAVSPLRGISSWGWQCWRDTIAALHRLRPHVLHIQYQTGAYAMHPAINLLPWRLRGLPGSPPCVVTFHDVLEPYLFPKAGYLRRWVTLRLARDARRVIVTNDADAASLHPPAPAVIPIGSNIPVAPPPGYQREEWRARLGVQRGDMLVAYFGLLSRSKGVDVLLQAIHHLHLCQHKPGTRFRLLIIGGTATAPQDRAYAAEVMQQLERLHLREHTIITGHVDEATVSAHLLAADCVALPFRTGASFRSGSLLAALSHGAAVVTTHPPYPIHSETLPSLLHGQHALLVPPEDMGALAEALQRLASDASLQGRLGTEAQNIGARFEWDAIARMHEEEYRRL